MSRFKTILSTVAAFAFLVIVMTGGAEAGALENKKLLVDTNVDAAAAAADKVNSGKTTASPVAAGATVVVELFVEDGGGNSTAGFEIKFLNTNNAFSDNWTITSVNAILAGLGAPTATGFATGGLAVVPITANGYIATVTLTAKVDIAEGATFQFADASIGVGTGLLDLVQDPLDTSESIVSFTQPPAPSLSASSNAVDIPIAGTASSAVTVSVSDAPDGATISWTVTTEGAGTLAITDADGNAVSLDENMMGGSGLSSLMITASGKSVTATVTATVDDVATDPAVITFTRLKAPVSGSGSGLMTGNAAQIPADGSAAPDVTVSLGDLPADTPIMWTVATTGAGNLVVLDENDNVVTLDENMMGGTNLGSLKLRVSGGSLQVTVSATVGTGDDAETTDAQVFTFTQLNPAELASFDGELQDNSVLLNWTTVSQTNNAGWRMLRSVDGENYEVVGDFVQGAGTSDGLLNYSFQDSNLPSGDRIFYVLEQVDLDGSVTRSSAVEVLLGARIPLPTEFSVNVYPNPFNPSTTISYDLPNAAPVSVVIYDALGQEVRRLVTRQASAGRYQIQWDARDSQGRGVASGVYIAKVEAGTFSLSQKMLLLK